MKLLLVGMFIISSKAVFAGKIVPNIEWNQVTFNETGAAVAQSERNLVSAMYSSTESEDANSNNKYSSKGRYISFSLSNDIVNAEGFAGFSDYEWNEETEEAKLIWLNVGKKFLDKLSIGINSYHINAKWGNSYRIGTSATYQINELISVGAGYNRDHSNTIDFVSTDLYAGVGFSKKDVFNAEITFEMSPYEEKKDGNITYSSDEKNGISAQATGNFGDFQISPKLSKLVYTDTENDEERIENSVSIEGEFKLFKSFYIGGYATSEITDYTDASYSDYNYTRTEQNTGFTARFKTEKIQIYGRFYTGTDVYEYNDNSDDDEEDNNGVTVMASYFL